MLTTQNINASHLFPHNLVFGVILISKLLKAANDPALALSYLKRKLLGFTSSREYVGAKKNRSDSENGTYVQAVQEAVNNYKAFSTFKRNPHYREILEHVSREQGSRYLEIIKRDSPALLNNIEAFKENDLVGNPVVFEYPSVGIISPTTLRYIKVASDLSILFSGDIGERVVEIGVGYGGQALINDRIFKIKEYELLDLPPVLNLVSKYLESHILNCAYKVATLNQKTGYDSYDLAISNYAFSELPSHLQIKYIEKILCRCKRGYLTMNSGLGQTFHSPNKLTIDQLKQYLPPFEIMKDDPFNFPNNYIIVWGNSNKI